VDDAARSAMATQNWRDNWRESIKDRKQPNGWCDVSVNDGWKTLVCDLVDAIDATGIEWWPVQIKEKFGTLRFYVEIGDGPSLEHILYFKDYKQMVKVAQKLIEEAQSKSAEICEDCGAAGAETYRKSLIATLCKPCFKKAEERWAKEQ